MSQDLELLVVSGPEGNSVYLNGLRIAGPKPWGGGQTLHTFRASEKDIKKALKMPKTKT